MHGNNSKASIVMWPVAKSANDLPVLSLSSNVPRLLACRQVQPESPNSYQSDVTDPTAFSFPRMDHSSYITPPFPEVITDLALLYAYGAHPVSSIKAGCLCKLQMNFHPAKIYLVATSDMPDVTNTAHWCSSARKSLAWHCSSAKQCDVYGHEILLHDSFGWGTRRPYRLPWCMQTLPLTIFSVCRIAQLHSRSPRPWTRWGRRGHAYASCVRRPMLLHRK